MPRPGGRASRRAAANQQTTWYSKYRGWIIGAAVSAVIVSLVAVTALREPQSTQDFQFTAYQGQGVLGLEGSQGEFRDVLELGRPVVLNFWGSDCPPCRAEMPYFEEASNRYGDRVIFFGLDVGPPFNLGTRSGAALLLEELGITYPAAYPESRSEPAFSRLSGLPQTVFYDAAGQAVRTGPGVITPSQLERVLRDEFGIRPG